MITQTLHQNWTLDMPGMGKLPAAVPGSVYADLLAAGKLEDPFWRDNEDKALALMENDFLYTASFVPQAGVLDCPHQVLRFEGVDTVADIRLNGVLLAHVENMHRTFEFDVAGILKPGENWLEVKLYSPTRWIREKYAQSPADGSSDAMRGFANLRKAHCMFGWDWGPHLPDAGIWRPVSLLGVEGARLPSVQVRQHHQHGRVKLSIQPELDYVTAQDITYTVELTGPQGQVEAFEGSPVEILIEHPQLWWPHGYGEQPLYTLKVTAFSQGKELDSWQRRIGLRTMTIAREKDEHGESFAHEVNGVKIFAMGADYIPEDNILSRVTPQRTRKLLEQLKDSGAEILICTKSDLVVRDIDLLKEMGKVTVSWSINTLDEDFKNDMDNAVSIKRRLDAMKQISDAGIRTVCFIAPVFPGITDFEAIFHQVRNQCDLVWLENLNLRGGFKKDILDYIQEKYPHLFPLYDTIYNKGDRSYFRGLEEQAEHLARECGCPFVDNELPYGRAEPGHPVIVDYFYHEEVRGSENSGKRTQKV